MNQHLYFLFILFAIVFSSCEVPATFTEPQPGKTKNLSKLPNRLQGKYISLTDSAILTVSDELIRRTKNVEYRFHQNELDSNEMLSGDTLINIRTKEKYPVKKIGDSLQCYILQIDTLLHLKSGDVIRKFKGYYFLNKRYDQEAWEVKKLQLTKGQLILSSISTENDFQNLKEIIELPQDTIPPYPFRATKKEFKEIIKNEGFSDQKIFIRLKK